MIPAVPEPGRRDARLGPARRSDASEIVVGAPALHDTHGGGFNRMMGELVGAMLARDDSLAVMTGSQRIASRFPGSVIPTRLRVLGEPSFRGNLARMVWHQTVLPRILRRRGAGVFFSPLPEGMLRPPCRQVVTIHDVIPLLHPEMFARMGAVYRHLVPRVVQASAAVVVMSEATRRDVERCYVDVLGDRPVHVVYQGYAAGIFHPLPKERVQEVRARHALSRFVLGVADVRPYKNTRRLIEAFAAGAFGTIQLALVGRAHTTDPTLSALPRMLGIEDRVRFLGFVPDAELAALYGAADAFVFPSSYEGFGLPALEAMACGCPVVAASAASLPEVCGDAAVYVDPHDTAGIVRGMAAVLGSPELRARLGAHGVERARSFTSARAAERVMKILEGVRT